MVTVTSALSPTDTDPLRNFKFLVTIAHFAKQATSAQFGFMTMSGLGVSVSSIEYREGGGNTTARKLPGQATFGPITLHRGVTLGPQNSWQWMLELFSAMGNGAGAGGNDFRSGQVEIDVLDHPITDGSSTTQIKARFIMYNAWPSAISYSDLDAGGNGIFMESMQLEHEGFDFTLAGNSPGAHL